MKTKYFSSSGGKFVIALALASATVGLSISPAFADNDDHGRNGRDHRRDDHRRGEWYHPEYRHPYVYAQPVYVPPPVYYAPRQSPGISLFFPLDFRR